ncbi:hypothetical protein WOSG25_011530 [Weissella oryzae SG25]|uniref:Uncharacterized protein n=1 Tax=Weissella oryzae (strain DSM 25784 / JCM 18191 / LMG 30913 / SG25) TaxID=1329250 RepID=A0A069CY85_WEIOS|nr:hypothetical protein [Weissella oryzae]GAK30061.1 hypothetical protein WOSG25_011530 [Weissella oryzae SG25]
MSLAKSIIEIALLFIAVTLFVVGRDIRRPYLMWIGGLVALLGVIVWFSVY